MKRHTYLNTAFVTSDKKYKEYTEEQYKEWRKNAKEQQIVLFVNSITEKYDRGCDGDNPFVRCTLTMAGKSESIKFHQYGTLLYTILAAISDITPEGDIKISTRKDGIFIENVKQREGVKVIVRNHIEILDDEARKVWENGGDDALDEFLLKYPKEHIANDRIETLCDRVLV